MAAADFGARYRAPAWLPGGDLQTIWAATRARHHRGAPPRFARERWDTPDGDFIDVDHLESAADDAGARHLVLFHGLEGSSTSPYAQAFACVARERGWRYSVPHFRGCSGIMNRAPRAYHSGDHVEIDWILRRLRERSARPLQVVGISLGGNALLRWAEEQGDAAAGVAAAIAAVSAPLDLTAAGMALDRGANRLIYARMFLATMKPRALAKLERFPGLFDGERVRAATTLRAFDDAFTAPVHGYRDAADYWARASAGPQLARLRLPTLLLNARNDPFVPAASLPGPAAVNGHVTLWQPAQGGHVGFPRGAAPPGDVFAMPAAVAGWLAAQG
ncbi:MAG: alpha/beta fold hydrolase [Burkholderiales bacterium]|nr:alpha/beta fold hydrolase [Burkholderiales bacterium]